MNLRNLFADLADRQPEVEAILAPGRAPLRFGDLPDRLDAVRRALNEAGIGRGDLVAVALRDGAETAVCLLGLISIAVAVPFNPDFTEDEVSRYFRRIRPKAVILPAGDGAAARRQAAIQGISIIDLAVDRTAPVGTFTLRSEARGEPTMPGWGEAEDLACIFLTSGSTAAPKLVPLRQRALLAYVQPMGQAFRLGPSDRGVHTVPMFHASGLNSSLLLPLVAGCGVVCPEGFDVPSFFANIETFRPTWYNSNYTTQRAILDQIEPYRAAARRAGLRFIRSGSGRLDPKTQSGLEEAFQAPVLECFSMSEVGCIAYNPLPPDPRKPGAVGITLIRDVRIIDDRGTPLAPGQEGEVVVRGLSVFDGYWDDPDANAELFIDGCFRTGDTGRFDGDGYLTLTGRLKETINHGGEKIAPAEVERVLLDHAAVRDACVFAVPHPTLGEEIAAAIVPATGAQVAERDLMEHAKARLAGFKVPRRIFICAEIPKGGTGKVQRRQVAEMCLAVWSPAARSSRDAPSRKPSPLEAEILTLWNTVIGIKSADIDQDFFLAGGDSLRAALLFARLRARFGVVLHLRQVFDDAATVAGIARLIEQAKGARAVAPALPSAIVPIKTGGDLAPIFAVPGLWGTSVGFVNLARLLDRRQPVYGLDSRGLDGEAPVLDRMAGIAADNIRRLKTVQPDGPYHLMGACFGAVVAYEMAQQLERAGDRVALLIMLDPSPPFTYGDGLARGEAARHRAPHRIVSLMRFLLGRVALHARTFAALDGVARGAYLREKAAVVRDMIVRRDLFRGDRTELHQRSVYEANQRAGHGYVPAPYGGPTVLCFTRGRPVRGERDRRTEWMTLVPQCGAPVYVGGRDTGDMVNPPHVYGLAEKVTSWLDAALADERRPHPPARERA